LGPEQQCLVAGDQRVAAEDGHEPGHSGSRQAADPPASLHPQGCKIRDRLEEGTAEVVPVRPDLRYAEPPCRERVANTRHLVPEAPLDLARDDMVALERRDHVHTEMPALARLELDLPAHLRAIDLATLRDDDLRLRAVVGVLEQELVVLLREADRHSLGQWFRAHRIAEREVVRLDGEDVGEVGLDLELEIETLSFHALVL